MRKYILLTTIATVVLAGIAYAADCTSVSDSVTETKCKNLGYTMTASQCSGKNMVKCPLNTNWVWCGDGSATGTTTPSCTYTYTDTSKADKNGGSCMNGSTTYYEKACSGTKQSACDTTANTFATTCTAVDGTKYGTCTSNCNYTITSTAMADASGGSCTKNGTTYYEKNCTGTAQTLCDTSTSSFTTICTSVSGKKYGLCTFIANSCDPQEYIWDRCPVTNGQCEQCGQRFKFSCCNSGYLYYSASAQNCQTTKGTDGQFAVTCKTGGGGGGSFEGSFDTVITDGNCSDPIYYSENQIVCDRLLCDPTSDYYRPDWICTK